MLDLVAAGEAEVGLVYRTDAIRHKKVHILTELSPDTHTPILYGLGTVWTSKDPSLAQRSYEFMIFPNHPRYFEIIRIRPGSPRAEYRKALGGNDDAIDGFCSAIHFTAFWFLTGLAFAVALNSIGCAATSPQHIRTVSEEGLNVVRVETNSGAERNTHPAALTPEEVGTILRGVRVWEQRNVIIASCQAKRRRHEPFETMSWPFWRLPFRGP